MCICVQQIYFSKVFLFFFAECLCFSYLRRNFLRDFLIFLFIFFVFYNENNAFLYNIQIVTSLTNPHMAQKYEDLIHNQAGDRLGLDLPDNQQNRRQNGYWKQKQQAKYIIFIDQFRKQLGSRQNRRNQRIFKLMSDFVQTRNAIQCRSHHTKLMRTYKTIVNIIQQFKNKLDISQFLQSQRKMINTNKLIQKSQVFTQKDDGKNYTIEELKKYTDIGVQTDFTVVGQPTNEGFQNCSHLNEINFYLYTGPCLWYYP